MSSSTPDGLRLAYSFDGREWVDLERLFLRPPETGGAFREAHLSRDGEGLFHIVWCGSDQDLRLRHSTSHDLESWSTTDLLSPPSLVQSARSCAAPQLYSLSDSEEFLLLWTSFTDGGPCVSQIHFSLTRDFRNWSTPEVLFDPRLSVDAVSLLRDETGWRVVFKNSIRNVGTRFYTATALNATGPFKVSEDFLQLEDQAGSLSLLPMHGTVLAYADHPEKDEVAVYETSDFQTWRNATQTTAIPAGQRNASFVAVEGALIGRLRRFEPSIIASVPAPALGGYTADPAIRAFGDAYYIYPTTDRPHWNTTEFVVWSSRNLIEWKREGVAMDVTKHLAWADLQAWAPDCVERDGTYFLYFCARGKIGVATSKSPAGPFRDALGKPLLQRGGSIITNTIDPHVLIDDDDQAYLYYGNGDTLQVFRLARTMLAVEGEPFTFKPRDFREGVVVFKRSGRYYFMWSIDDARSPDYRVGWGVADSPFGPILSPEREEQFIVLKRNGRAIGTAHHSVVNVPGTDRWYVAYHRHAVPGGGGYKRETCIVRMEFDASGAILPMDPLSTPFKPGDEGEPLINGRGRL